MEYVLQERIEYQIQILERNEISYILPHHWSDGKIHYDETGIKSIYEFLSQQRELDEITDLLRGLQEVIEQSPEIFLDEDRWVWDINQCFWDGKTIKGMYIPDRVYTSSPYLMYEQITYTALLNILKNNWYDEKVILLLYRVYGAAVRKERETLIGEIDGKYEGVEDSVKSSFIDTVTTDTELFQEWDSLQMEVPEQKTKRKQKRKLSLPFF